jgi:hypothetical protein
MERQRDKGEVTDQSKLFWQGTSAAMAWTKSDLTLEHLYLFAFLRTDWKR